MNKNRKLLSIISMLVVLVMVASLVVGCDAFDVPDFSLDDLKVDGYDGASVDSKTKTISVTCPAGVTEFDLGSLKLPGNAITVKAKTTAGEVIDDNLIDLTNGDVSYKLTFCIGGIDVPGEWTLNITIAEDELGGSDSGDDYGYVHPTKSTIAHIDTLVDTMVSVQVLAEYGLKTDDDGYQAKHDECKAELEGDSEAVEFIDNITSMFESAGITDDQLVSISDLYTKYGEDFVYGLITLTATVGGMTGGATPMASVNPGLQLDKELLANIGNIKPILAEIMDIISPSQLSTLVSVYLLQRSVGHDFSNSYWEETAKQFDDADEIIANMANFTAYVEDSRQNLAELLYPAVHTAYQLIDTLVVKADTAKLQSIGNTISDVYAVLDGEGTFDDLDTADIAQSLGYIGEMLKKVPSTVTNRDDIAKLIFTGLNGDISLDKAKDAVSNIDLLAVVGDLLEGITADDVDKLLDYYVEVASIGSTDSPKFGAAIGKLIRFASGKITASIDAVYTDRDQLVNGLVALMDVFEGGGGIRRQAISAAIDELYVIASDTSDDYASSYVDIMTAIMEISEPTTVEETIMASAIFTPFVPTGTSQERMVGYVTGMYRFYYVDSNNVWSDFRGNDENCIITGYDPDVEGYQELTVTYLDASTTVGIYVCDEEHYAEHFYVSNIRVELTNRQFIDKSLTDEQMKEQLLKSCPDVTLEYVEFEHMCYHPGSFYGAPEVLLPENAVEGLNTGLYGLDLGSYGTYYVPFEYYLYDSENIVEIDAVISISNSNIYEGFTLEDISFKALVMLSNGTISLYDDIEVAVVGDTLPNTVGEHTIEVVYNGETYTVEYEVESYLECLMNQIDSNGTSSSYVGNHSEHIFYLDSILGEYDDYLDMRISFDYVIDGLTTSDDMYDYATVQQFIDYLTEEYGYTITSAKTFFGCRLECSFESNGEKYNFTIDFNYDPDFWMYF